MTTKTITTRPSTPTATITRTTRTAIRLGEDFTTIESVITLPVGATDDDIANALALDDRLFTAQQAQMAQQVALVRATAADAPAPAPLPMTGKQQSYLNSLALDWGWQQGINDAGFAGYVKAAGFDPEAIDRNAATALIDMLKKGHDPRQGAPNETAGARPPADSEQDIPF